MAKKRLRDERPKAIWGAIIPAVLSTAASIYGTSESAKQQKEAIRRQQEQINAQNRLTNLGNQATTLNNYFASIPEDDREYIYALGGKAGRKGRKLKITDGGVGVPLGDGMFLLEGGSHADVNESGQTGIGLKVGNKPFEAEGGEIVRRTPQGAVVYSDRLPIDNNGTTPVDLIMAGENPDRVQMIQDTVKQMLGLGRRRLRNAGSSPVERTKAAWGDWFGGRVRLGGSFNWPSAATRLTNLNNRFTIPNSYLSSLGSYINKLYTPSTPSYSAADINDLPEVLVPGNRQYVNPSPITIKNTPIQVRPQSTPTETNVSPLYGMKNNPWGAEWGLADWVGLGTNIAGSLLANTHRNAHWNSVMSAYDDFEKSLQGYTPSGFVAGPTRYDNTAKLAATSRLADNSRRNIFRNTASSSNTLNRMQDVNTTEAEELNKIFDENALRNFEARRDNATQFNEYMRQEAANRNQYNAQMAGIRSELAMNKAAMMNANLESNVGMINGIGQSIGNFLQQGIDRYEDRIARGLITATSQYGTPERIASMVPNYYDSKDIRNMAADAYSRYSMNPTKENKERYDFWSRLANKPKGNRGGFLKGLFGRRKGLAS